MEQLILTSAKRRLELEQKHFPNGVTPDQIKLLDDVQELLSRAYQAGKRDAERFAPQAWSNQSCMGYAIMAAEHLAWDEAQIQKLVRSMQNRFDFKTLEEAAEHYRQSPY